MAVSARNAVEAQYDRPWGDVFPSPTPVYNAGDAATAIDLPTSIGESTGDGRRVDRYFEIVGLDAFDVF